MTSGNAPTVSPSDADHETIWLAPKCNEGCAEGRSWAPDNPWGERCEDCEAKPVKYIRFDLHTAAMPQAGDAPDLMKLAEAWALNAAGYGSASPEASDAKAALLNYIATLRTQPLTTSDAKSSMSASTGEVLRLHDEAVRTSRWWTEIGHARWVAKAKYEEAERAFRTAIAAASTRSSAVEECARVAEECLISLSAPEEHLALVDETADLVSQQIAAAIRALTPSSSTDREKGNG